MTNTEQQRQAQMHEKARQAFRSMSREEKLLRLKKLEILDEDGHLAEHYRRGVPKPAG